MNELARQLVHVEHPNSDDVLHRQNKLNARYKEESSIIIDECIELMSCIYYDYRWAQLRDMVDQKRAELDRAHRLETFRIDCQETVTWIEDKTRLEKEGREGRGQSIRLQSSRRFGCPHE